MGFVGLSKRQVPIRLFLFYLTEVFILSLYIAYNVFSSPEDEVLIVSYCARSKAVVRRLLSVVPRDVPTILHK